MFKILKIGHVEFEVRDLARMTDYYSEVMGLTVTDKDADTAYLSTVIDHHSVVLRQGKEGTKLTKVAFQVAPSEAKDLVNHLENHGADTEIRTGSQPAINQVVRTINPDGLAIELYSEFEPVSHPYSFRGVNPLKLSHSGARAGIASSETFVDAAQATGIAADVSVNAILQDWDRAEKRLRDAAGKGKLFSIEKAILLAPLRPVTIYCAGANYRDHVIAAMRATGLPPDPDPHEAGLKPWHFIKPFSTVVGDGATVDVVSAKLDWEAELAVVIGRPARNVSIANALDYVAGYANANNLSARDLISRAGLPDLSPFKYDWIGQKCFDGSCPLGRFIVPAAEIPDPQNLSIKLTVNGEIKQQSNTSQMLFTAAEQIAHLSSRLTLNPGDVILTGTPAGTGMERGEFLKTGDVVRVEIERLGGLTTIIGNLETRP